VTAHPTAEWTAQQLREAFPWDSGPRFLLRDRDRIFGREFTDQLKDMGIREVLSTPRVPQQRAYIERVIGTIRRECLDHVIVFSEAGLFRHLRNFVDYYHETRTHLALEKDTPEHRVVQVPASGASSSDTAGGRLASPIRATSSVTRNLKRTFPWAWLPGKSIARLLLVAGVFHTM